jgi:hypothetical protein
VDHNENRITSKQTHNQDKQIFRTTIIHLHYIRFVQPILLITSRRASSDRYIVHSYPPCAENKKKKNPPALDAERPTRMRVVAQGMTPPKLDCWKIDGHGMIMYKVVS